MSAMQPRMSPGIAPSSVVPGCQHRDPLATHPNSSVQWSGPYQIAKPASVCRVASVSCFALVAARREPNMTEGGQRKVRVITGVGGWPAQIADAGAGGRGRGVRHHHLRRAVARFDAHHGGGSHRDGTRRLADLGDHRLSAQPMVLAMEAWDIQHLSRGRFVLGLGSQVKGHNERRFGGTWTAPAPRMREYIQMMHEVWASWQDGKQPEFPRQALHLHADDPQLQPGAHRLPPPQGRVGDGRPRHGEGCRRRGRCRHAPRRDHVRQVHARGAAAGGSGGPRAIRPRLERLGGRRERLSRGG